MAKVIELTATIAETEKLRVAGLLCPWVVYEAHTNGDLLYRHDFYTEERAQAFVAQPRERHSKHVILHITLPEGLEI